MKRRSRTVSALAVAVLLQLVASTAIAGDPAVGDGSPQMAAIYGTDGTYVPLSADQLAALDKKKQVVEAAAAMTVRTPAPNGINATCRNGICGTILPTWYRHQAKSYYCGPAAVQVISNHAWSMPSGGNKYTQQYISDHWTHTDADGQTYVWRVRYGLNGSTAGKYPWPFAEEYVSNPAVWHDHVVVDATDFGMPSVAGVAPHDPNFGYYLTSWPTAITAGHYIVTRGWLYLWDDTRTPIVYYNDGSAGYGGSDGQFSDPAYDIWKTIKKSNPNHSEGWIVW